MTQKKRKRYSIVVRWFLNGVGLATILVILICTWLIIGLRNRYYTDFQKVLSSRTEILVNLLEVSGSEYTDIDKAAKEFIENFDDKESMELMILDDSGNLLITSTGFETASGTPMPDFRTALNSADGCGFWKGRLQSGERAMACTQLFSLSDRAGGAIRVLVSLAPMENELVIISVFIVLIGLLILGFVFSSGLYFVRSLLHSIKAVSSTARRIATGNFDVRLEKQYDDEIGDLCDTINEMAGELGNAERMKNDFISSVSHELRTPLTAIKGWAETLRLSGSGNPAMTARGLEVIETESERLCSLVEDLLDFSRMQNGRLQMQMHRLDPIPIIREIVNMLQESAERRDIHLVYHEPRTISMIRGDEKRIRQAFLNIIENAVKYSENGGTVRIEIHESGRWLHTLIADNGCGISSEDLPKVTDKFYKANMTRRGSGIGLALADEIIQMHQGTLHINSKLGEGTAVEILLPIAP